MENDKMIWKRKHYKDVLLYVVAIIVTIVSISPIIWMFLTSLKSRVETFAVPPILWPHIPFFRRYITAWNESSLALFNSAVISACATGLTMILAAFAAFGLARTNTSGSKNIQFWILTMRMCPPASFVLPFFLIIYNARLLDSKVALIMIYTLFNLPFAIWMMTIFFRELPIAMEEAALIDGCSWFQVLRYITIPLSVSALFVVSIFVFYFCWNELMFALVLTTNKAVTLPVLIGQFRGIVEIRWEDMAAFSVIQTMPVIALSIFLQKYILAGLTFGAVKT